MTRYLAAQSLGWETLDVRVVVLGSANSPLAVVKSSRLHNDTQRETELDHALLAEKLRKAGHKPAEIVAALGYGSERGITRLKAFFELPDSILVAGKANPEKFSASLAETLKKAVSIIGEEETLRILKQTFAENLSRRRTESLVRTEELRQQREANLRPRRICYQDIHLGGDKIGRLDVWETPERQHKIQISALLDKARGVQWVEQLQIFLQASLEDVAETEDA
ncbi:MAG: hypothetical protein LBB76_08730 [Azoarcus sp.]|nr:hypothetical protein [Azoarcus sp.]